MLAAHAPHAYAAPVTQTDKNRQMDTGARLPIQKAMDP